MLQFVKYLNAFIKKKKKHEKKTNPLTWENASVKIAKR